MYDTMPYIKLREAAMCIGQACTMGSLLLAAGATGMRRALPNSRTAARPGWWAGLFSVIDYMYVVLSSSRNYDTSPILTHFHATIQHADALYELVMRVRFAS